MAFTHTKKVDTESFIKARIRNRIRIRSQMSGSGSDQKGLDPTGSGSATLDTTHCKPSDAEWQTVLHMQPTSAGPGTLCRIFHAGNVKISSTLIHFLMFGTPEANQYDLLSDKF
jgi:hypothetical protein